MKTQLIFRFLFEYIKFNNNEKIFPRNRFFKNFSDDVCMPVNCCPVNAFGGYGIYFCDKDVKYINFQKLYFHIFI